ncbi:MAG: beta-lactamase family protein [Bacteroidales bacterium]|nr:beta-lactamase family protein [Bacteroidales bacterium]
MKIIFSCLKKLTIILLIILFSCSNNNQSNIDLKIRQLAKQTVEKNKIPGIAISVFSSDTVFSIVYYGVKKMNSVDSLTSGSRFHIGSCGKAFLCYVAVDLVNKNLISWDSKFFDFFPEYKKEANDSYPDFNLKQLLTHRAGLPHYKLASNEIIKPFIFSDTSFTRQQLFSWALSKKACNNCFQYSNIGYVMAAAMLEKVGKKSWKELITELVFTPLRIKGKFGWPAMDSTQTYGHWINPANNELLIQNPKDNFSLENFSTDAAGDINLSIEDYIRFLQDNLRGIKGKAAILTSDEYKLMHNGAQYGLGWELLRNYHGFRNVSLHKGSPGSFYCQAVLLKNHDIGVLIITNSSFNNQERIFENLTIEILSNI